MKLSHEPRKNPLFYEKDGSLNLSWFFIGFFSIILAIVILAASKINNTVAIVASLSAVTGILTTFILAAVSQNKAKILKDATLPSSIAKEVSSVLIREHGANTEDIPIDSVGK